MAESENLSYVCLSLLQANCQRSYGVMCDIGQRVLEYNIQVCMFQEPYVREGRLCGLPAGTSIFLSPSGGAAVVVFDKNYACMRIDACDFPDGVYIWVKGPVGEMVVVSLYCRPDGGVNDCLVYLDATLRVADGKRVLIGMNANATSDVWFSKSIHRGRRNERRGVSFGDWINGKGLVVLNQPTAAYTFCGPRGMSDIDVLFLGVVDAASSGR